MRIVHQRLGGDYKGNGLPPSTCRWPASHRRRKRFGPRVNGALALRTLRFDVPPDLSFLGPSVMVGKVVSSFLANTRQGRARCSARRRDPGGGLFADRVEQLLRAWCAAHHALDA